MTLLLKTEVNNCIVDFILSCLEYFLWTRVGFPVVYTTEFDIATDHWLDGPGSNSGGDEIFRPSRPALGPTQPPVQWVPGLSQGQIAAGACC